MRAVLDRLSEELKTLEFELRVELPREIKTAVAMGDLRENAEYHAALERQSFVRARIGQLRERLTALSAIDMDRIPKDRVGLGSTVTLLDTDTDNEVCYELVVPEVADLDKGLISIASPIGKSLVGKFEGDEVNVKIPVGERNFDILKVVTLHDKKTKK